MRISKTSSKARCASWRWAVIGVGVAVFASMGTTAQAIVTDEGDLANVDSVHGGHIEHCDDSVVPPFVDSLFLDAFNCGDELFETRFNAVDGVGANVGDGGRFTRIPRADLEAWRNQTPPRATGPNSAACNGCHDQPADDGAGEVAKNNVRDPFHTKDFGQTIQRQAVHVFGSGALQVLAEEMNEDLERLVRRARRQACSSRTVVVNPLRSKGVNFGSVKVIPEKHGRCRPTVRKVVDGVDKDLVVKPFQWKGSDPTVRAFNRGASHQELGMQAVELTGDDFDGDGDGVVNEMSIADQTALAVYVAGQPRPVTQIELTEHLNSGVLVLDAEHAEALGLPLTQDEIDAINRGEGVFSRTGCAKCHRPQLPINDPIFSEPSQNPNYRDEVFPAGQDPVARGVDPENPITFDLTSDLPDNVLLDDTKLGSFTETDARGRTIVRLFGDLKRHYMGPGLAEQIDEVGTGAAVFMTKELWGVGSTDQYLHDGRATTLKEAILEHGGEAANARKKFRNLDEFDEADLIAFLNNLVLLKLE